MASRRLRKKRLKKSLTLKHYPIEEPKEERSRSEDLELQRTRPSTTVSESKIKTRTRKRAIEKAKARKNTFKAQASISAGSGTRLSSSNEETKKLEKKNERERKKYQRGLKKREAKARKKAHLKAKREQQKAQTKARNKALNKAKRSIGKDVQSIIDEQQRQFQENARQTVPTESNTASVNMIEQVSSMIERFYEQVNSADNIKLREYKKGVLARVLDTFEAHAYSLASENVSAYEDYLASILEEMNEQLGAIAYASSQYQVDDGYAKFIALVYHTPYIPIEDAKAFEDWKFDTMQEPYQVKE